MICVHASNQLWFQALCLHAIYNMPPLPLSLVPYIQLYTCHHIPLCHVHVHVLSRSEWHKFTPFTNVLWVNYLTVKTKIKGKLKGIHTKVWEAKFKPYLRNILKYTSVKDVFFNIFNPDKPLRYHAPRSESSKPRPAAAL